MKFKLLSALAVLSLGCQDEGNKSPASPPGPTDSTCTTDPAVSLSTSQFMVKSQSGEQKVAELKFCGSVAPEVLVELENPECSSLKLRVDLDSNAIFADPAQLKAGLSCKGLLKFSVEQKSFEQSFVASIVDAGPGDGGFPTPPPVTNPDLQMTLRVVGSSYEAKLTTLPFVSRARIFDTANVDYAGFTSFNSQVAQLGYKIDSVEELDTRLLRLTKGSGLALDANSQTLPMLDSFANFVSDVEKLNLTTVESYRVSAEKNLPALYIQHKDGPGATFANDAGIGLILGEKFPTCFLPFVSGITLPAAIQSKTGSMSKCSVEFGLDLLPNLRFKLSTKKLGDIGVDSVDFKTYAVAPLTMFSDEICSVVNVANFNALTADFFNAGWVSRSSFLTQDDFQAECRLFVYKRILPKLADAVKASAVQGQSGVNVFADKTLASLAKPIDGNVDGKDSEALDKAFYALIDQEQTTVAWNFSRSADFTARDLQQAMQGYSGDANAFAQVVDAYFAAKLKDTGVASAFIKAYASKSPDVQSRLKKRFAQLLLRDCKTNEPVAINCVMTSVSKIQRYSIRAQGLNGPSVFAFALGSN